MSKHRKRKHRKSAKVKDQDQRDRPNNNGKAKDSSEDEHGLTTNALVEINTDAKVVCEINTDAICEMDTDANVNATNSKSAGRKRQIEVEVGKVLSCPGGEKRLKLNQNWMNCGCPVVQIHRTNCPRPLYLPEEEVEEEEQEIQKSSENKKTLLRHVQQNGIRSKILKLRELERYWMDQLADGGGSAN